MNDNDEIGVFLGLDVGKSAHHGHGLTPAGKKVFDRQLPNTEPKLRDVFTRLKTKFGTVLVIVDQPASIGALPLTVARDVGCQVAYLPGLAMRRVRRLLPARGGADSGSRLSITSGRTPQWARNIPAVSPTGPPPTTSTGTFSVRITRPPDVVARLAATLHAQVGLSSS
ncbi:hypothetical protein GCM10010365_16000 [Streptomyces poonensis]|uniref:Transposase IS110-like N-terminal domain-containing protein n=1 Tax=Streptomyces poonensis TaxID=68255 RepID=A0A918UDV7_9ACTN|nr:hypothetical protein GCM10010365_16000 [Streptomyces poonensis]